MTNTHTPEEQAFMNRCYAKYQYYWLLKHGYALHDVLLNFGTALKKQTPHILDIDWHIQAWQNQKPLDSDIYASFHDFAINKYKNPTLMKEILTTVEYQQYLFYQNQTKN